MSQTAYGLLQTPLPGVIFDDAHVQDILSAANLDPTWNIPFGVMVARDTTHGNAANVANARMPSGSGDEMLGVVVLDHTHDPGPNGTLVQSGVVGTAPGPGLASGAVFGAYRRGRITVLIENDVAVTVGSPAFVRFTQNGAGKLQLGALRMDSDGGKAVAVNARFMSGPLTVPATTPFPGQSAGAGQSTVLTAVLEFDAAGAVI